MRQLVDATPTGWDRRALEVCTLARTTTESLLREVLGIEDVHERFAWLRGLSFVESGPDGVFPPDLARDAFEADLRWRDPDAYRRVFRAVRSYVVDRLATARGREQQRALFELKFLFRHQPDMATALDWGSWGQHYPEPARPADIATILDLAQTWEGPGAAAIARRWWDEQADGFFVVRGEDGEIRGFLTMLNLTRASAQDITADPGATAAWEYARRHGPPRPGEVITQLRFTVDRQAHQASSPTFNAASILSMQHWSQTPKLAWYFVTLTAPDKWNDYFPFADVPQAVGADFSIGGQRYGLFAHDLRQVPLDTWLDLLARNPS